MTAEIVALNHGAVALAADSAVTVTMAGRQKVLRTADKLFALSETQPVAVMFYNNASLMDIPWETIIKCYRKQLGDRSFDRVADYAQDFLSYTANYYEHAPGGTLEAWVRLQVVAVLMSWKEASEVAFSLFEREDVREEVARELEAELTDCDPFEGVSAEMAAKITKTRVATVKEYLNKQRGSPPGKTLRARLHRIGQLSVTRHMKKGEHAPLMTGLVVAGFGEADVFPSARNYSLSGLLTENGACWSQLGATDLDEDGDPVEFNSQIIPFAQSETVEGFMTGIEPRLLEEVHSLVADKLGDLAERVDEHFHEMSSPERAELSDLLEEWGDGLLNEFHTDLKEIKQNEFVAPIIEMVEMLPRFDLAAAAEALVSLQSFKRRVTMDAETVSAPVDVVVISKGDGLVWVKRKGEG